MSKINQNFFLGDDDSKTKYIGKLLKKLSGSKNKELRKIMLDVFLRDKAYDIKDIKNEILLEICNTFYNIGIENDNLSEVREKIGYKRDYDVFVRGGKKYKPVFAQSEITIADLWIDKYQVTQDKWKEIMSTDPSNRKGERLPVENVSWIDTLYFCNKMSKKYGLQPAYKIENSTLTKIIYSDGEEVEPNLADFTSTEGYRLPTELEWEWAARGGNSAIGQGTFSFSYSGSNNVNEVAWYNANSGISYSVGMKKPNQLGLYDMSGNVCEWCYDSASDGYISEDKPYIYDGSVVRRLKGGSYFNAASGSEVTHRFSYDLANRSSNYGFRVCRTV